MSNFRENIETELKEKRPNLNPSSLKTYVSILFNLNKKLNPDNETLDWFNEDVQILDHLKEKSPQTRKTVLSALFVLTSNENYQSQMIDDCKLTNEMYKSQKKSQKEEDNWMNLSEIKEIYDNLYQRVSLMFSQKLIADYTTINNFILLGSLGGVSGLSPRRSKDYTEMKIKNYTNQDNFFKAGKFYFNVYKTATDYGEQVIDVKQKAPEFYKILNKWVKINPTEYLLFSSNKQKLTSPQITRMLNKLLGKNVSSSMLRHIYLTEKYGDIQNEMEQTSKDMAHSSNMQSLYIKK
jgi:integrase